MIGKTISHYKILEKLGEGGMGVVYKAEDTSLRRMVALKFLSHLVLGMGHEKARLAREAQAAAALDHPNICTIYEVDEVEGETFIAMALVDGGTLRDKISEGPLTLAEVMDLAIQIAQGLCAAHGKGIIHRDIKPGNVMITSEGRAKILDFGLAKSPECTRITVTGTTAGTVAYMSPEQTRGRDVDHRSDIWSFGVMFFEMLTGRRPFEGGHDQAVIHSILNDELPSVSELRPDVPEDLERITAGALIKSVEERYQSIEDVLEDLRSIGTVGATATVPLSAPRPVQVRRAAGLLRQWRAWLVAAAAVIAVSVAGIAIYEAMIGDGTAATGPHEPERVLVAAFDNRTGDASLDYIGHSAATSVSEGVAQTGVAEVTTHATEEAASGGAGQDSGATSKLLAIARDAGASVLVAGSFHVQSDSLNIEARLLDVPTGMILNAISGGVGPLATPAAAIAKTRSRVMGALAVRADPTIMCDARSHAPTYEAYREYAAGVALLEEKPEKALEHFERVAVLDPAFSGARVWQMRALGALWRRAELDSLVQSVMSRPEHLTPHTRLLVEAQSADVRGDYAEALRKLRELVRVEPEHPLVRRMCALSAERLNRPREVIEVCGGLMVQGQQTDAHAEWWVYFRLAVAHHMLGDFERELEITRQAIEVFPDRLSFREREAYALAALGRAEQIHGILAEASSTPVGSESALPVYRILSWAGEELKAHGHTEKAVAMWEYLLEWQQIQVAIEGDTDESRFRLGEALYRTERWEEARVLFEELTLADPDNVLYKLNLGLVAARMGDREVALDVKRAMIASDAPNEFGYSPLLAALIAVQLGEREEAMVLLNSALAEGNDGMRYVHRAVDLEPLWDYPPFQRLIEPKG